MSIYKFNSFLYSAYPRLPVTGVQIVKEKWQKWRKKTAISAIIELKSMISFHRKPTEASFTTHFFQNLIRNKPITSLNTFGTQKHTKNDFFLPLPLNFRMCVKIPKINEKRYNRRTKGATNLQIESLMHITNPNIGIGLHFWHSKYFF